MFSNKIVGILLAGGRSRRFGSPKMFAQIMEQPFYKFSYHAMRTYVDEVVIVTRENLQKQFPDEITTITDLTPFSGMGPLAGIYSAMEHLKAEKYIVLPCDMPLIDEHIIKKLLTYSGDDLTVVKINEQIQPLVSVWSYKLKNVIYHALINNEKRMKDFLTRVNGHVVDATLLTNKDQLYRFINVNTPQDDEELRKWIKS